MKTTTSPVQPKVAIQSLLRPELSPVRANKDYKRFCETIASIDGILRESQVEKSAIEFAVDNLLKASPEADEGELAKHGKLAIKSLRTNVLRMLLGNPSCRKLSTDIYMSPLLADFCRVLEIDGTIKGLSKSAVGRTLKFFSEEELRLLHMNLTEICANAESCGKIGLEQPIDASLDFFDSTCQEADIHFPVDWVLFRDVVRTLLKAVTLIRKAGLFCRMPQTPAAFAREMNRLCIAMTHSARQKDGKKTRKRIFRQMKKLLTKIGNHAQRHRDAFSERWEETEYTGAQKDRILARIDRMLGQLPQVKKQAHERILGERKVANNEKILSVYEEDLHVIVRRKAGREVEFGNTLMICESAHGYIVDWKLYRGQAPSESDQLIESLERQNKMDIEKPVFAACTDRGFASKKTSNELKDRRIYDATCPRDPAALKERLSEKLFADLQRRRGSTEARIAILRQKQGGRLHQRGFINRALAVAWSVLSHNLWLLARQLAQQDEQLQQVA